MCAPQCSGVLHRPVLVLAGVLVALLGTLHQGEATTRLGLHVSQEELWCWRQRAQIDAQGTNGITCPVKYRVAGDVSTNSPGNWTDMVNRKNTFNSNPAADHWTGQTTNACVTPGQDLPGQDPDNNVDLGEELLAAAFYTMVANDATTGANVRNELLALAGEAGLNFANTSRWCKTGNTNDGNPYFMIAIWANRMLYAYEYLQIADQVYGTAILSGGNTTTLNTWFQGMGSYWVWMGACGTPPSSGDEFWVNRTGENYTTTGIDTTQIGTLYFGGPAVQAFHGYHNNRRSAEVHLLAMLGIKYNDSTWNRCAKRWWKEWIRYGVWSDGSQGDLERWEAGGLTNLGWGYSSGQVMQMASIADTYARNGDFELYTYSTSEGINGSQGGPKTIILACDALMKYADHTFARYATTNAGDVGNSDYLIDMRSELAGTHYIGDTWYALPNLYVYTVDPTTAAHIKAVSLRTATDQVLGGTIPGYPASPSSNTYPWGGAGGTWPAIPFMWGQLEDNAAVNPFATAASAPPTVTITAPTSGATHSTSTTPLTTLAGSATDDVGVTSVTWACPTCTPTSGTATCGTCGAAATAVTWSVGSIGLVAGTNIITVTANDGDTQTGTDQLTVTYTPPAANVAAPFRLVR